MNILLFTAIYPSKEDNRIPSDTKAIHYFAKQWAKLGHRVEVIHLYQNPLKKIQLSDFVNIFTPKISEYWYEGIHVNLFETQLLVPHANTPLSFQIHSFEKMARKIIKKLDDFIPDLISMHFPMSFYNCKMINEFDCPSMAVFHNCDINAACKLKKNKVIDYLKKFKKLGSRSEKIQKELLNKYNLQSELIYSGISEDLIDNDTSVINKKILKDAICNIIFVGNLVPLKKVDNILEAAKKLKFDYKICIVGDGIEKNKLIDMTKKLNIQDKVLFTGRVSRKEAVDLMRTSDVFVMTSSPETFGLVYLEAMAQGCIVIGSKNEGIDGVIINNYNGYLVSPDNIEELSETLNNIYLLNNDKKKNISINGYRTAKEMTSENMANKYLELILKDSNKL